ncbi:MAG: LysR substrate-binding domain-containing protein, partial [Bacteroidota bacterium]
MTITQLEYIVAVADCKSFAKAAEKCHITQPTLSVQIKKLENHLKVSLFDRTKKPVQPTTIGLQVIEQARMTLSELSRISDIIKTEQEDSNGEIRLGIIPTLSPYLLPLFSGSFLDKNPGTQLFIKEMLTEEILFDLYNNNIDIGILVTPLENHDLKQIPLFHEPFIVYMSNNHILSENDDIDLCDLDLNEMWLLKAGHCYRNQVLNLCSQNAMRENKKAIRFESGSIETLRRIVEKQQGYTLLPKLATLEFAPQQQQMVKEFLDPKPVREVSIVLHRRFVKTNVVESLKQSILENIPSEFTQH